MIAEGVAVLQRALARDRLGEFQAQAAIAALHADAPTAAQTDWVQIVEWYDELARLADSPVVRLNRAVAVGEADGPPGRFGRPGVGGRVGAPLHGRARAPAGAGPGTGPPRLASTPRRPTGRPPSPNATTCCVRPRV